MKLGTVAPSYQQLPCPSYSPTSEFLLPESSLIVPALQLQEDNREDYQCPGTSEKNQGKGSYQRKFVSHSWIYEDHWALASSSHLEVPPSPGVGECWWERTDAKSSVITQNSRPGVILKGLDFLIILNIALEAHSWLFFSVYLEWEWIFLSNGNMI